VIEFREPPRTGFELRWMMLGVRFRVLPSFFLISALVGYLFVGPNVVAIALDVGCIFVAIVFTELVQGLIYRSYGLRSTVLVQELGGGIYPEAEPPLRIQRIVVALASPASSFLLFALVYYSNQEYHWADVNPYARFAYVILYFISLFWGILGFLPMFPWPGGRVLMEVLGFLSPRYGFELTLWFSILLGIVLISDTVWLMLGHRSELPYLNQLGYTARVFLGVFFVLATIRNWQYLQYARAMRRGYQEPVDDYGDRSPWER
jgi:hypothetical protein